MGTCRSGRTAESRWTHDRLLLRVPTSRTPMAGFRSACGAGRREDQDERDAEAEDAQRFRDGEAEDQVAELLLRGGRVADRGLQVVAEDRAHADAGAGHGDASE